MTEQRADPIKRPRYGKASIDRLIELYVEACGDEKAAMAKNNMRRQHRAMDMLGRCTAELKRRGADGEQQLIALLDHPESHVRLHAAGAVMALAPERARAVMEVIAQAGNQDRLPWEERNLAMSASLSLLLRDKGWVKDE